MNRLSRPVFLAVLAAVLAIAGCLGWHHHTQRRAWQAMIPPLPAPASDAAPGLAVRLRADLMRLQAWPPDREALAEFTALCHANGALEEAMAGYRALMVLEPNEPRWPHLLASILAGYGRLDEALPLLRRTTVLAPDHRVAWLRWGEALLKSNAPAAAEAAYREALRRAPGDPYALVGLARCDLQAGRWTAARQRLEQAVAEHPDSASAQSLLATVFDRLGNARGAAAARARVVDGRQRLEPADDWTEALTAYCYRPYILLTAAAAAAAGGTPRRALAPLERALTLAPDDARLHRQLAKIRVELGDPAAARLQFEQAVRLSPDDDTMYQDLIGLLRSEGDVAAVAQAVAQGLAHCPGSEALQLEAGLLAADAGRLDEAVAHLERAIQIRPDQTGAALKLAELQFGAGRTEAGVAVLEALLRRHPHDEAARLMLARHGIQTGDARTGARIKPAEATDAAGGPSSALIALRQDDQHHRGPTPTAP